LRKKPFGVELKDLFLLLSVKIDDPIFPAKFIAEFMKTVFCLFFLLCLWTPLGAQTVKNKPLGVAARVDRRIELTSIVARLAEYDEYVTNDLKSYAADVDQYYAPYKNHPAIQYARKARAERGIGFDAVPSLAVHLNQNFTPKFAFSDSAPDARWGKTAAEEFARLLQQFYKDTNSEAFFASHAELYKTSEQRMQSVIEKIDFEWYKNFYGEVPRGTFSLYVGLLNGGMNFGPKVVYPDGKEELFAVIGAWKTDDKGLPVFADDFLPTIIHEFNHSFINHLVKEREKQFQPAGEKIYQPVRDKMARLAYGNWKTMIDESLVRAAVIRYLFDHNDKEKTALALMYERNVGFLWIEELFVLLGTFENSRQTYPTFRSFLPMIEAYAVDLAKRVDDKAQAFAERQPRVAAIEGLANGAQDVDPKLTQITFIFDKPLVGKGVSMNFGTGGRDAYPEVEKVVGYSADRTKFTLQVKLKPNWQYEFVLTGNAFRTPDGYPLDNYTVKFKTRKE
jgi:hypothetical protein